MIKTYKRRKYKSWCAYRRWYLSYHIHWTTLKDYSFPFKRTQNYFFDTATNELHFYPELTE